MILNIVIIVLAIIGAFLAFAATRPDDFRVERAVRIKASPDKIYPHINDFHRWTAWSPYEKLDPTMKKTLSGPKLGKGSVYEWSGNSKAGEGRMEIIEDTSLSKVRIKLDFSKPFVAHNVSEFTFKPTGDSTDVTWAMMGSRSFVMKAMGIFMNMDNLIGKDFVVGLDTLKQIAEQDDRVLVPDSLGG